MHGSSHVIRRARNLATARSDPVRDDYGAQDNTTATKSKSGRTGTLSLSWRVSGDGPTASHPDHDVKLITEFNLEIDYEKHDDEICLAVRTGVGADRIHIAGVAGYLGSHCTVLDWINTGGGRFLTLIERRPTVLGVRGRVMIGPYALSARHPQTRIRQKAGWVTFNSSN